MSASKQKPTKELSRKVLTSLIRNRELTALEVIMVMNDMGTDDVDMLEELINELRNCFDSLD